MKTGESLGGTELAVAVIVLQVVGFGWSRPKLGEMVDEMVGAMPCPVEVKLEFLEVLGKSIVQRKLGRSPGVLVKVPRDTESSHGKRAVARRCFGDSRLLMFCLSVVVTINATDCVRAQFGGSGIKKGSLTVMPTYNCRAWRYLGTPMFQTNVIADDAGRRHDYQGRIM